MKGKFVILFFVLIVLLGINLVLGSVILPQSVWFNWLNGTHTETAYQSIINYRLLKAITAILTGAGLGLSGLLMQRIFRNPIVGPYILGLSSGAGLGVAFLLLGSTAVGWQFVSNAGITLAAALGSVLTLLLILGFYYKVKNTVSLLIIGLMIGIFSGAVINILSYFTQADNLQKFVFWSMGNLGNNNWEQIRILLIISLLSFVVVIFLIKPLNAILLSENYAKSMGFNIKTTNIRVILITGILTGSITALVGPIAFVGLAVPHIARLIFKTQLLQVLFPAVLLTGSILMLFCDTIAQVPGHILVLPINSITVLIGAPLVISLILRQK